MTEAVLFPLLVGVLAVLDATAIISARYYHELKRPAIKWLSLAAFAASGYVYVQLLAYRVTAIINIIYIGVSTILVTAICYWAFKEKVSWGQAAGIALVVLGINLL